jgi:hypothetical protein
MMRADGCFELYSHERNDFYDRMPKVHPGVLEATCHGCRWNMTMIDA